MSSPADILNQPLVLQHLNDSPVYVPDSYFTAADVALAEIVRKHICLTSSQLYEHIQLSSLRGRISKSRVSSLIKHGFLARYRIVMHDDTSLCFYMTGHKSRFVPPTLDANQALALINTNQFLLAQKIIGKLRYTVMHNFPVTAAIKTSKQTYTCIYPNKMQVPEIPDVERIIALLPDRALTAEIDKSFNAPVRYVFNDSPEHFWRFDPETGCLHEAQVGLLSAS